jgi:hypothetical protein
VIARKMKRSERATYQKAYALGVTLLDYNVAAADDAAVYDVRCQRDSLTLAKFIVCH